jgi:hypothetical protein
VLCIGGIFLDPVGTLILFSITGVIFWGWLNLYLLKISNISMKEGLTDYIHYCMIGLVIALPLIIFKLLWPQYLYLLLGTGIIVTFMYYGIIIQKDSVLKASMTKIVRR